VVDLFQVFQFQVAQPLGSQRGVEPGLQQRRVERLGQVVGGPISMQRVTLSISSRAEIMITGMCRRALSPFTCSSTW